MPDRARFPVGNMSWEKIRAEMLDRSRDDIDWRAGRAALFVFKADEETARIGRDAYFEFFSENALGRTRAFHGIGAMERDVIDYGLSMLCAPPDAAGAFTTGGSESIFLAMKAARDALRARAGFEARDGQLNIVMPITGHPGFDKAADVMDLEIRRGPVGPDKRCGADALRPLIDERTIAVVGSAPCFPHGVIDHIAELSDLAEATSVWLHVDACVGGWIAPWFRANGRAIPDFDFRLPGVRSISADLHKFGFCPKPASTVFYRMADDLARATFKADFWPNGRFETATLAGTRPGGAVAAAWAVLNHLGEEGYRRIANELAMMVDAYVGGVEAQGFRPIARPDLTILNFGSDEVDIFQVAEILHKRGWLPGLTREPKGLHLMMSLLHEPAREAYLRDLAAALEQVRAGQAGVPDIEATY